MPSDAATSLEAKRPTVLAGRVVDRDGAPVEAATVSAFPTTVYVFDGQASDSATTDSRGEFLLDNIEAQLEYSITALAPGHAPGYLITSDLPKNQARDSLTLSMGSGATRTVRGRVLKTDKSPAINAPVRAFPGKRRKHEVLSTKTNDRGEFELPVTSDKYMLIADAPEHNFVVERIATGTGDVRATLTLRPGTPEKPDAAASDLRAAAIAVSVAKTFSSTASSSKLDQLLCPARVIGMGEATHGSAEFTRLRGNLFLHLASSCGFRLLLLEADTSAVLELDHYVLTGQGSPKDALSHTGNWIFMHADMIALVEAIRHFNVKATDPIRIIGIDPFFSHGPAKALMDFVASRDPALRDSLRPDLEALLDAKSWMNYGGLSSESKDRARRALKQLRAFVLSRERLEPDRQVWLSTMLQLRALESSEKRHSVDRSEVGIARDQDMAENVKWALDVLVPKSKAVLSAHNGHVMLARPVWKTSTLGDLLADVFGKRYVAVGAFFGKGSFAAIDISHGKGNSVKDFTFGDRMLSGFEPVLREVGLPAFIVDLEAKEISSSTRTWLKGELAHREVGDVFTSEAGAVQHVAPATTFNLVVFVDEVTAIERFSF